jgi:hypothetical protein
MSFSHAIGVALVGGALAFGRGAQAGPKTSGIYLTATDYAQAKLTALGECNEDSQKHKLEVHDLLNKPYIDVTHDGEHQRHAKADLFGYRSCDGLDYRLIGNLEYRILEARELYIYTHEVPARLGKGTARGQSELADYFFSVGAEGPVQPLTVPNVKKAFPNNHRFHDSLDAAFGWWTGPEQYDDFHHMFRVNHLLETADAR